MARHFVQLVFVIFVFSSLYSHVLPYVAIIKQSTAIPCAQKHELCPIVKETV